ncbi:hypothetical protein Poli38472_003871 [Pythium oligandrum]|uniref:Palmitoyl-protein thioesterase 1 n=1 Tax=Pythium oligandrum TaxID=41045 RepID=A0A8K1FKJ0_PYTOL|nr:hypothetical protein Poli38472_003871 [Pythium oligandrum]|eukprot:TMW66106.1 hypothetical protein Poli38472_003871 [Pythium oligandrum]
MNTTTRMVVLLTALATVLIFALQMATYGWVVAKYMVVETHASSTHMRSVDAKSANPPVFAELKPLPVVLMHGMGDAAGNSGMKEIRDLTAKTLGTYVVNIPIGNSVAEDVRNSFFVNMDDQLEIFAKEVRKDPELSNGFNAAGFSQGNLLIRAYIQRYNDPPVYNFISFHGPLAGVGALPQCKPTAFICKEIDRDSLAVLCHRTEHLAQANYFRHPLKIHEYLQYAKFLPDLNNEKPTPNATYKANFIRLQNLVLIRAKRDTQVFPKDSEWFGAFLDGTYDKILGFNETRWYQEDLFGLQTLDRLGRVHFLETDGNHLQFTTKFFLQVVEKYFAPTLAHPVNSYLL